MECGFSFFFPPHSLSLSKMEGIYRGGGYIAAPSPFQSIHPESFFSTNNEKVTSIVVVEASFLPYVMGTWVKYQVCMIHMLPSTPY